MAKPFKKHDGTVIEDLKAYCQDQIEKNPDIILYIGCDSQRINKGIIYATIIVFRYPLHGGHVIHRKEVIPSKGVDMYTRLWGEVEKTIEIANFVRDEVGHKKIVVSLDYNPNKMHKSNAVYASAIGYVKGLGYDDVQIKPDAWCASHAADAYCKS